MTYSIETRFGPRGDYTDNTAIQELSLQTTFPNFRTHTFLLVTVRTKAVYHGAPCIFSAWARPTPCHIGSRVGSVLGVTAQPPLQSKSSRSKPRFLIFALTPFSLSPSGPGPCTMGLLAYFPHGRDLPHVILGRESVRS